MDAAFTSTALHKKAVKPLGINGEHTRNAGGNMLVSFAARHEGRRAGDNADAARRAVFAERLKAAMGRKGWGLS
ncbi:MAG TPA: hypothetical protein VHG30_13605, partial [Microvirga sp.]|nr:hypothetical protein [Microvirga sp.]